MLIFKLLLTIGAVSSVVFLIARYRRNARKKDPEQFGILVLAAWIKSLPPDAQLMEGAYEEFRQAKSLSEMHSLVHRYPMLAVPGFVENTETPLMQGLQPSEVLRQRQRLTWLKQAAKDMRCSMPFAIESLYQSQIHYELRAAVEKFPILTSEFFQTISSTIFCPFIPKEFRSVLVYQLRWIQECYPKPPLIVSQNHDQQPMLFQSIEAGLKAKSEIKTHWAHEIEQAFLRCDSKDNMRIVAMNYPLLLRPAVQGGIDAAADELEEPRRSDYSAKLRWLQELREEIEGHFVESWWRPIMREQGLESLRRRT